MWSSLHITNVKRYNICISEVVITIALENEMDNYLLSPDEFTIFEEDVSWKGKYGTSHLILTNLAIVFTRRFREGKAFHKTWQTSVDVFPLENLKMNNGSPQIRQVLTEVNIQMTNVYLEIAFNGIGSARKFASLLRENVTGKAVAERGADKVKGAIGLVDDTLGINTVETVKGFVENGVVGTVVGGIKGRKKEKQDVVSGAVEIAHDLIGKSKRQKQAQIEEKQPETPTLSYDEQIDAVKKMKELLDAGILTQEEFDNKKKEILGL